MEMRNQVLIIFVCILETYYCVQVPFNPCPRIFTYVFHNKNWLGHITVPSPPYSAYTANINVSYSIPGSISAYKNLELDEYDRALEKIRNGESLKFISPFPKSKYLPQVTGIIWNGRPICRGPAVEPPSSWFSLSYTYKWMTVYYNQPIYFPEPQVPSIEAPTNYVKPSQNQFTYQTTENPYKQPLIITEPVQPAQEIPIYQPPSPEPIDFQTIDSKFPVFTDSPITPSTEEPKKFRNYRECGLIRKKRTLDKDKDEFVRRIINGTIISRNSHPWLAALFDLGDGKFFCAGNLISNKHVLTAAHCVIAKRHSNMQARLGVHNTRNLFDPGSQIKSVKNCIEHPDYKEGRAHADVAFIILDSEVQFTQAIKPICLWNYDSNFETIVGYIATIMGWGRNENGEPTNLPMKTDVTIRTNQECKNNNLLRNLITDETFCAGARGSGPCLGDSGGGLFISIDGKWYLRGIISSSVANKFTLICDTNSFSVYVDTAKYMNWIVNNMEND